MPYAARQNRRVTDDNPLPGAYGRGMGRRTTRERARERHVHPEPLAYDTTWAGEGCAALLLGLLLAIDAAAGTLTDLRAALWLGLAVLLFAVLWPARVSAGRGSLVS